MDITATEDPKQEKPGPATNENEVNDPWKLYTLEDAKKERPPREFVVEGMLKLPSLNIVYAAPGDLKTMLMIDLCGCVAGGFDWLPPAPWLPGAQPKKVTQSPVLWLDFDNGEDEMMGRIQAIANALDLSNDTPFYYYVMPNPWLNAANLDQVGQLSQRIKKLGAKLVVIDNLGNVSGGLDENSNQMIQVMSNLRQLAEETRAAVIVIHHQRKGNANAKDNGRAGDALRGHSSIEAAIDLALHVKRENDNLTIKATKTRGREILPFGAVFTYDNKQDGELDKFRFYGVKSEDNSSNAAIEAAIKDALKDGFLNQTNLIDKLKGSGITVSKHVIRGVADHMVYQEKIKCTAGSHNSKVYSL